MNPEKFARFFYEQGQSQATDSVMRKTKNIDMTERSAPEAKIVSQGGLQVKVTISAIEPRIKNKKY